mmetsp:Transcript_49101/g.91490  ORF Transcript_49101/g.91490 Transcript_49101/m.91490 type:complete len:237 (-) Transcript_49101:353-1063(-)
MPSPWRVLGLPCHLSLPFGYTPRRFASWTAREVTLPLPLGLRRARVAGSHHAGGWRVHSWARRELSSPAACQAARSQQLCGVRLRVGCLCGQHRTPDRSCCRHPTRRFVVDCCLARLQSAGPSCFSSPEHWFRAPRAALAPFRLLFLCMRPARWGADGHDQLGCAWRLPGAPPPPPPGRRRERLAAQRWQTWLTNPRPAVSAVALVLRVRPWPVAWRVAHPAPLAYPRPISSGHHL